MSDEPRDAVEGDASLLAELARVLEVADPPPEEVQLAARSALAHRDLDAQLAALMLDSGAEAGDREPAGVRGAPTGTRELTFGAGDVVVDLSVEPDGERQLVRGQCSPAGIVEVQARSRDLPVETVSDALGQFVVRVPRGPFSLRLRWRGGEQRVDTEWVVL